MKKLIILCLLLLLGNGAFAQMSDAFEQKLIQKIKLFDEFAARFNFETMPDGKAITAELKNPQNRKEYLISLFDKTNPKAAATHAKHAEFKGFVEKFTDEVSTKDLKFKTYTEGILAEVEYKTTFRGKAQNIRLFLEIENTENGGKKWVIRHVVAPFVISNANKSKDIFIPPNSDGSEFIGLKKFVCVEKNSAGLYPKDFTFDPLSQFYAAVQNGDLILLNAISLNYHVLAIQNWAFIVQNFNREGMNTGWLIADLFSFNGSSDEYLRSQIK